MEELKFIHLLYVPTMACNLACKYCYLEDATIDDSKNMPPLATLRYAIEKLKESNVVPFNISLHGGEVTTLSEGSFRELIAYIRQYYHENASLITEHGFRIGAPHIKTNLYDLKRHMDTIREFEVSISGSLDLPFSLHDQYRLTKGGEPTLSRILENVALLDTIPNRKKVSATIFKEHFTHMEELISDIWYLHQNTCLDMNDFNFMIGFADGYRLLTPLTEEEQTELFHRMHKEFDNTELDKGVNGAWFNEFGPEYCVNCDNCGEKFFLLEKDGSIYSCVRGQKKENFYYGNIFQDTVETILSTASRKIYENHNREPFSEACADCGYLYLCKTGCPFVKNVYHSNRSYTCLLQQELYKSRGYEADANPKETLYAYIRKMHPQLLPDYIPDLPETGSGTVLVEKLLPQLVKEDPRLRYIYDPEVFFLVVDGMEYRLESQILKKMREIIHITRESEVFLYVADYLLDSEAAYPYNNYLYLMCLSGDCIIYGDEQRLKQTHLFSHQVYKGVLEKSPSDRAGFFRISLDGLLREYADVYSQENPNNLFFTTGALRDYHYQKQKENAYYHIQAINLPFQNIEFYYLNVALEKPY